MKDRALGKDVFNFAIELRNDISRSTEQPSIVGVVGSFHIPKIGYLIRPGMLLLTHNFLHPGQSNHCKTMPAEATPLKL